MERRKRSKPRTVATLAPDWKALLDDASTEMEVVRVTKDYLATWTPQEIYGLPEDCRPGPIKDGTDVSYWAFELTRIHCAGASDPEIAELVVKMMTFFSHASARLSQVLAAPKSGDAIGTRP
jgi:hypothetical protein